MPEKNMGKTILYDNESIKAIKDKLENLRKQLNSFSRWLHY